MAFGGKDKGMHLWPLSWKGGWAPLSQGLGGVPRRPCQGGFSLIPSPRSVLEFLPVGGFLRISSHQKGADSDFWSRDTMDLWRGRWEGLEVSGSHHFGTNWVPIDWAWLPENFRCGLAPRTLSQGCDLHQVTDQGSQTACGLPVWLEAGAVGLGCSENRHTIFTWLYIGGWKGWWRFGVGWWLEGLVEIWGGLKHPSGFPGGSDCKESACSAGDLGSIPGSGRCPGEGNGYPLQYSCLENSMDRGARQAAVHGDCKKSDTTEQLTLFFT